MGSNCLVTMTQQEIETWQTSPQGRGILKSKVDRGCSPHTSVMQDRRCMEVICAPPDSVWAKHHRIVGASRSTVEQVHVTTATAKETSCTGFQLADRDDYGLDSRKEICQLCQQQGWRVGRCMQCPESSAVRKLFESIWARCHSACREHQKPADRSVHRTSPSTLGTRKIATDVE